MCPNFILPPYKIYSFVCTLNINNNLRFLKEYSFYKILKLIINFNLKTTKDAIKNFEFIYFMCIQYTNLLLLHISSLLLGKGSFP